MRRETKTDVKAVILYGSYGRGDAVSDSDVDVCVFTAIERTRTEEAIRDQVPNLPNKPLNLVVYSQEAVHAMLDYGSLFLWHIKLEGKVLLGHEYVESLMKELKPFVRHHDEILYHKDLLLDIEDAVNSSWTPNELDLSLLFTISRNTCMILSHKRGEPVFDRYECYKTARRLCPDLPLTSQTFFYLSKWKTIYERTPDPSANLPDRNDMQRLISETQRLLDYGHEHTK